MRVATQQDANGHMNDTGLKAKLSLSWTGPYKVLAVGPFPSPDDPDDPPLSDKFLCLNVPS